MNAETRIDIVGRAIASAAWCGIGTRALTADVQHGARLFTAAWTGLWNTETVEQISVDIKMTGICHVGNGCKGFINQVNLNVENRIRTRLHCHRSIVWDTEPQPRVNGRGVNVARNTRAHSFLFHRAPASLISILRKRALSARV